MNASGAVRPESTNWETDMDQSRWIVASFVLLVGGAVSGCSSAGSGGSPAAGGSAGSGASGGTSGTGGIPDAGTGGSGGSGGSDAGGAGGSSGGPPVYVSNTPGATVTEVPAADVTGLTVVSSNLIDEASGGQYYQKWTGLIYNGTPKVVCYPKVSAKFFNSGTEVGSHLAFADTEPHLLPSSTLTASCLQPGSIGALYSNGFFSSPLSSITEITFDVEGLVYDSVPLHPAAPTFSGVALSEKFGVGSGYWAATGSLNAVSTIHNISIDVYPVGTDGLVPDKLIDANLDTVSAGSSYAFETTSYQGLKADKQLLAFADFLDGAKSFAAAAPPSAGSEDAAQLWALAATATTPEEHDVVQEKLRGYRAAMAERFRSSR